MCPASARLTRSEVRLGKGRRRDSGPGGGVPEDTSTRRRPFRPSGSTRASRCSGNCVDARHNENRSPPAKRQEEGGKEEEEPSPATNISLTRGKKESDGSYPQQKALSKKTAKSCPCNPTEGRRRLGDYELKGGNPARQGTVQEMVTGEKKIQRPYPERGRFEKRLHPMRPL